MTIALMDDESEVDIPKLRRAPLVKRPPLFGWREDVFRQPHVRKLVRRRIRKDFLEASYAITTLLTAHRKEERKVAQVLRRDFLAHYKKWQQETAFSSSVSDMVLHPSYQRIIGMGPAILPIIIRELAKTPDHWFWALEAITGQNPVPQAERGRIKQMAQRWLDWARMERIVE